MKPQNIKTGNPQMAQIYADSICELRRNLRILVTGVLCLSVISLGCASPVPDAPIQLAWDASPDEAVGSAYVVYELDPTPSANWAVLTNVPPAVHGVILSAPVYGARYTVTLLGADGLTESPMSNLVTNLNLRGAGTLKIHR
jgi:hypothetical protein